MSLILFFVLDYVSLPAVGGGIVKGPLMLAMEVHPAVGEYGSKHYNNA